MLTVDVGNTTIGVGEWLGDEVELHAFASVDEAAEALSGKGQGVAISVAPPRLDRLREAVARRGTESLRVLDGVPVRLGDPRLATTAGADRFANALAIQPGPALAVDVGTAITIDLVDATGTFLGGFIAPGPESALRGLERAAPALPAVDLVPCDLSPAGETTGAIVAGAWGLAVGGIDRLVDAAVDRLGHPAALDLVATGGWGAAWASASRHSAVRVDRALVHRGIRAWASRS